MKYLLLLILLSVSTLHLHAQEVDMSDRGASPVSKNLFDYTASPVFFGLTYDRVLTPRHIISVTAKTCNYLPIIYSLVSISYKHYPTEIALQPEMWTKRSMVQAGVEVLPYFPLTNDTGISPYVAGSLEFSRKWLFIRPTLTVGYPLTIRKGRVELPTPKDILLMSALTSIGMTTIGFRF